MLASRSSSQSLLVINKSILRGDVTVSGAKNAVLRYLAATLLTPDKITIVNCPMGQSDVQIHIDMLRALGKSCETDGSTLIVREVSTPPTELTWNQRSIRNTLLILGALVARTGSGAVPLPGGCAIGADNKDRAYDLHVLVLESLGARVYASENLLYAEAPSGLVGAEIHLPIRSTGATENGILAGCLAKGKTTIWNPHIRPEIIDLIAFLSKMGAQITVYGQERIEVTGVQGLHGVEHRVIPDNVEALTWLVGAAITGGEIEIHDFPYEHLEVPLIHLRESGVRMFRGESSLVVRGSSCYPLEISTGPYPGINSDMQPLLAVFGARARGESRYIDLRFPGRYAYANELSKMGVHHEVAGNMLKIHGGSTLRGANVTALDLRAGVALALAGFIAEGETVIDDAWQISRGYDRFAEKVTALGGQAEWRE